MRPTALGLKALAFYLTVTVSFFVSPYTSLFFLLLAFLSCVLVLSVAWSAWSLKGVTADLLPIEPAPTGGEIELCAELRSTHQRPRFDLGVECRIGGERFRSARCQHLQGPGSARIAGTAEAPERGVHPVGGIFLDSTYPLGVVRRRVPIHGPAEVVVYPAPLLTVGDREHRNVVEASEGLLSECHVQTGEDLSPGGLREYRAGDPLRDVHWKASARRRDLVVKEWDSLGERGIEVVLDRRTPDGAELERSLAVVSTLALRCRETKEPLSFKSQGIEKTFGGDGQDPVNDLLRWLAGAQPLPADGPAPPMAAAGALRLPHEQIAVEAAT